MSKKNGKQDFSLPEEAGFPEYDRDGDMYLPEEEFDMATFEAKVKAHQDEVVQIDHTLDTPPAEKEEPYQPTDADFAAIDKDRAKSGDSSDDPEYLKYLEEEADKYLEMQENYDYPVDTTHWVGGCMEMA